MNNKENIELIESYINDLLSADKRKEVEQRMATDAEFRGAVEFQQKMHEHFQDDGRQRFRAAVQGVMEENPVLKEPPESPIPGKPRPTIIKWLGLLAVLFMAGFFIWQWGMPSPSPQSPPIEVEPPKALENKPDDVPAKPEPVEQKPKVSRPMAMAEAANFAIHAGMEASLAGSSRGQGIKIKLSKPLNGTAFNPGKKGITAIDFRGTVDGFSEAESASFLLSIYNNRDGNNSIDSIRFELQKDDSGEFSFDITRQLRLTRGLYYFAIDDSELNRVYTGKFTIGKYKK